MYEYKYRIGLLHKATGKTLHLEVWAKNVDEATHKLCGVLIGFNCEYEWTGSGLLYENKEVIRRDAKN